MEAVDTPSVGNKILNGLPDESEESTAYNVFEEVIIKEEPHNDQEESQSDENKEKEMIDFPTCDRNPLSLENDPLELDRCIKKEIKLEEYEVLGQGDTIKELTCEYFCRDIQSRIDQTGKNDRPEHANEESKKHRSSNSVILKNTDSVLPNSKVNSDMDINNELCSSDNFEDSSVEVGGTNLDKNDSNDRKYFCNCCNQSFNRLDHLKSHCYIHTDFRVNLMEELVKEKLQASNKICNKKRRKPSVTPSDKRLDGKLHLIGKSEKGSIRCLVCKKRKLRKETVYYCKTCPGNPYLHPDKCFEDFHTKEDFV